ncbi:MAG TPA: hypothetical protein VH143_04085 [Kofleriaceae bacterium]|jgi:hypothetical protein|nr:hypothetical protein [Kofleriaceae bacterium]
MGDPRVSASELRCVAPLVTIGDAPVLVGSCTLVTNGDRAIAFSSAELLRKAAEPLAIYTRLDGSSTIPVKAWKLGLSGSIGIIEIPPGTAFSTDVHPLYLASVHASLDTRGAPSGLVVFDAGFTRRLVGVHVDNGDPAGEDPIWLATPASEDNAGNVDGAPLFAWMPPDPVLGRASEVVAVALAISYRGALVPRARAPIAELIGLDDLGRVLPWAEQTPPPRTELEQVAGEIGKKP